ncbi:MAG TPA: hypothetical protein PKM32_04935 [Planctomycetota bacterium]|nr:hypothetical protein [Planctomycetota bacterium]
MKTLIVALLLVSGSVMAAPLSMDTDIEYLSWCEDNKVSSLDDKGKIVKQFSDGLPAKVTFTMPATSKHFVLQIGQQKIIQNIEYPEA